MKVFQLLLVVVVFLVGLVIGLGRAQTRFAASVAPTPALSNMDRVTLPLANAPGVPTRGTPVLFIGDSNMAGHGATPGALTPVDVAALDLSLLGKPIAAVNMAEGGTGLADWLPGVPAPWYVLGGREPLLARALDQVRARHIHLAVVCLGTNDTYIGHRLTARVWAADARRIVATLKRAGVTVVWDVPLWLPRTTAPYLPDSNALLGSFLPEIPRLGAVMGDITAYRYFSHHPELYDADRVHIDDAGIAVWGRMLADGLAPLL